MKAKRDEVITDLINRYKGDEEIVIVALSGKEIVEHANSRNKLKKDPDGKALDTILTMFAMATEDDYFDLAWEGWVE